MQNPPGGFKNKIEKVVLKLSLGNTEVQETSKIKKQKRVSNNQNNSLLDNAVPCHHLREIGFDKRNCTAML